MSRPFKLYVLYAREGRETWRYVGQNRMNPPTHYFEREGEVIAVADNLVRAMFVEASDTDLRLDEAEEGEGPPPFACLSSSLAELYGQLPPGSMIELTVRRAQGGKDA